MTTGAGVSHMPTRASVARKAMTRTKLARVKSGQGAPEGEIASCSDPEEIKPSLKGFVDLLGGEKMGTERHYCTEHEESKPRGVSNSG